VTGIASLFGASGGVAISIVRPITKGFGTLGEYLTGIGGLFGYTVAAVWAIAMIEEDALGGFGLDSGVTWAAIIVCSIVFGITATWAWRKNKSVDE